MLIETLPRVLRKQDRYSGSIGICACFEPRTRWRHVWWRTGHFAHTKKMLNVFRCTFLLARFLEADALEDATHRAPPRTFQSARTDNQQYDSREPAQGRRQPVAHVSPRAAPTPAPTLLRARAMPALRTKDIGKFLSLLRSSTKPHAPPARPPPALPPRRYRTLPTASPRQTRAASPPSFFQHISSGPTSLAVFPVILIYPGFATSRGRDGIPKATPFRSRGGRIAAVIVPASAPSSCAFSSSSSFCSSPSPSSLRSSSPE